MQQQPKLTAKAQYFQTSDGSEYIIDDFGVHQINAKPFVYDEKYCAIYDSPDRKAKSDILQALRLGFIIGANGWTPDTILDYGCGNFAFLSFAKKSIRACVGYDIADYPIPDDISMTTVISDHFDVVCFHDSLEHTEYPASVISSLNCATIVISLPHCHIQERGIEWFDKEYFHRKPGEHLHHYSQYDLERFMRSLGWKKVAYGNHEDHVREREGELWNILSMAFKRDPNFNQIKVL